MSINTENRLHMLEVAMRQAQADIKNIKKMVGKETQDRLEALEEFATYADNMLTELNHALPDPEYDAKREAEVAGVDASLDRHRERLGLNKPQLKQLDQSVFNNMHERWKFAAVDKNGSAHRFNKEVFPYRGGFCYEGEDCNELKFSLIGKGYDASNWQNSLIERDIAKEPVEVDLSSDLTGSELCKAMLKRGDKRIMCVSLSGYAMVITGFDGDKFVDSRGVKWGNAAPINNQDEPLTAAEAGL